MVVCMCNFIVIFTCWLEVIRFESYRVKGNLIEFCLRISFSEFFKPCPTSVAACR